MALSAQALEVLATRMRTSKDKDPIPLAASLPRGRLEFPSHQRNPGSQRLQLGREAVVLKEKSDVMGRGPRKVGVLSSPMLVL